eukprot:1157651-Pelagomonas_calceolata.AAC.5
MVWRVPEPFKDRYHERGRGAAGRPRVETRTWSSARLARVTDPVSWRSAPCSPRAPHYSSTPT